MKHVHLRFARLTHVKSIENATIRIRLRLGLFIGDVFARLGAKPRQAIVVDSSIVIFRSTMFSKASLKMGHSPISVAATPITLKCETAPRAEIRPRPQLQPRTQCGQAQPTPRCAPVRLFSAEVRFVGF
jgi:hypothetical protein